MKNTGGYVYIRIIIVVYHSITGINKSWYAMITITNIKLNLKINLSVEKILLNYPLINWMLYDWGKLIDGFVNIGNIRNVFPFLLPETSQFLYAYTCVLEFGSNFVHFLKKFEL